MAKLLFIGNILYLPIDIWVDVRDRKHSVQKYISATNTGQVLPSNLVVTKSEIIGQFPDIREADNLADYMKKYNS